MVTPQSQNVHKLPQKRISQWSPICWQMAYFYMFCSKNILTKQVGYQQPTCRCVKMEFVVGTISLSCELYSLSWSCFRSCGAGIIVYGKWCFVSHVQCCGSCMVSTTGVRDGKGGLPPPWLGNISGQTMFQAKRKLFKNPER